MLLRFPCGGIAATAFDGGAALSPPNDAHHQKRAGSCEKHRYPGCRYPDRRYRHSVTIRGNTRTRRILSLDHPREVQKRGKEHRWDRKQPSHYSSDDFHALPAHEIRRALVRERYADFGPKLAHEKLVEVHGIRVGRETLRGWLSEAGIWLPRAVRTLRVHQPRHRRQCLGELVQIDGCDHEWFEARADRCTALVYVDDATGKLMELRFVVSESAFDYFAATESYLGHHGKPVAFYSDKHSIFRVNQEGASGRAGGITQFGRALGVLNIDIICANTPQAKGRVERMNKTLQDRLVKEMRLRGVKDRLRDIQKISKNKDFCSS
jgi:hypothetical protein